MKSYKILVFFIFALNALAYSQDNPLYIRCPKFENKHWLFQTDQYDTSMTGSWSYVQPLQKPLMGVTSYYRADVNTIFICGGLDSNGLRQASCYYYNISNNSYDSTAPLPEGRWSGKLVRFADSLYLVGSVGANFNTPDGKIFRYSINTNTWQQKSLMPVPYLIESAVCVYKDSAIITIGGSTSGFQQATSIIRSYNPYLDTWTLSPTIYPKTTTTADAQCYTDTTRDSTGTITAIPTYIIVMGGYGTVINDLVYKGVVELLTDSIYYQVPYVTWIYHDLSPFPGGVYRVSGGMWNKMPVFGPGIYDTTTMGQIYGLRYVDTDSIFHWVQLLPDIIDSNSNIPQIAVSPGIDSTHFYFFGGTRNLKFTNRVKEYSVAGQPPPIGINNISHSLPKNFELHQNYPNPFNPSTIIKFDVSTHGSFNGELIRLVVYDILGREVAVLFNGYQKPGSYQIKFDASNLASGIYFYSLISGNFRDTKKMLLIK